MNESTSATGASGSDGAAHDTPDMLLARGTRLLEEGHLDEARRHLLEAARRASERSDIWTWLGVAESQLDRHDASLAAFDRAVDLAGSDASAQLHANRSIELQYLGRPDEALAAADAALARDDRVGWSERGHALYTLQRFAEAEQALGRALALDASNVADWTTRGMTLLCLVRPEEALEMFEHALAAAPDGRSMQMLHPAGAPTRLQRGETQLALLWMNKANGLMALERFDEARAALDRALALDAALVPAYASRAMLLLRSGRAEEALESAERAVVLDPRAVGPRFVQAEALLTLQRADEALAAADAALALDPRSVGSLQSRQKALVALGRDEEARAAAEQVAIAIRPFLP